MFVQYVAWARDVLSGDFGLSLEYRRPVSEVIGDRHVADRRGGARRRSSSSG